jgi:hypothetical protein
MDETVLSIVERKLMGGKERICEWFSFAFLWFVFLQVMKGDIIIMPFVF